MQLTACTSDPTTPRDAQNLRSFHYWTVVLGVWLILATFLVETQPLRGTAVGWVFPIAAAFLAAMTVRAYVRFIRNADELLRKIHLEALAWGMGAALIFMPAYRLCERLGAAKLDSVDPLVVIVVAWAIGHWRGLRQYALPPETV